MTALTLLRDLREVGIAVQALPGGVLVLTTPAGVRLELLPRTREREFYALVQEHDHFVQLCTDGARLPRCEASALAWRFLLASHTPRGDDT